MSNFVPIPAYYKANSNLMRPFVLTVLLASFILSAHAQPMSKKGEPFLPEAGEYALSIDAAPFLFFVGNIFSANGNQSPGVAFIDPELAIRLKMFRRHDLATRVGVRLGIMSDTWNGFQPEFSPTATDNNVRDSYNRMLTNIYFSYGIEKRKGSTRIQGYYGVEGGIGLASERHSFRYGNAIQADNQAPDRTEFELVFQNPEASTMTNFTDNNAYVTDYRLGTQFRLGARAFVGAEMFIFPKVSLGIELGLGAMVALRGKGTLETEAWTIPTGGGAETLVTRTSELGGGSTIGIDTDNTRGSILLNFHF